MLICFLFTEKNSIFAVHQGYLNTLINIYYEYSLRLQYGDLGD